MVRHEVVCFIVLQCYIRSAAKIAAETQFRFANNAAGFLSLAHTERRKRTWDPTRTLSPLSLSLPSDMVMHNPAQHRPPKHTYLHYVADIFYILSKLIVLPLYI